MSIQKYEKGGLGFTKSKFKCLLELGFCLVLFYNTRALVLHLLLTTAGLYVVESYQSH